MSTPRSRVPAGRVVDLARGGWGLALLGSPRAVLTRLDGREPDHRAVVVARVLGARHLVQALVSGASPGPVTLAVGAWADGAHSLSALALAALDRRRARSALLDAAVAGSWALASRHAARAAERRGGAPSSRLGRGVERLAGALRPLLPGAGR